jgi:alkanesulfonate monooxygenase SsuD/methylene tetrahydromethanopterin reductase-like flavin-dependent oxidoreductase (luciferase family)
MKFGLRNTSFVYPGGTGDIWEDTRTHAQRAERDGFVSFWVMVSSVGYRNPALLARMAASLDHISGGRLNFGFGAGGFEPEYRAYGFEFIQRASVRLARMKEALQLILKLWSEPLTTFRGEYFQAEEAVLEPKPLQKPHPPVLIGGVGPKITLRIIAELGDACNLWGPPAYFSEQREMLARHCEAVGRDEATVEKTTYDLVVCAPTQAGLRAKVRRLLPQGVEPWMALVGTPAQLVDVVGAYERAGADHLCLDFAGNDAESYALFVSEVMSKF